MKKNMIAITLLVVIIINSNYLGYCAQNNTKVYSGLLLGLRSDSDGKSNYRTLWITIHDGKVKILENEGIFVAYGNDFWRVENRLVKKQIPNDFDISDIQIEYLVSYPVGQEKIIGAQIDNYLKEISQYWIRINQSSKIAFVGNKYVCIQRTYDYESGGTLRPWEKDIYIKEIKDITRSFEFSYHDPDSDEQKRVSIKEFFGERADMYINKYKSMEISESEQFLYGTEPIVTNETDEFSWGLARRRGRWTPQIAKKWSFSNMSTGNRDYTLYDLPLKAPQNLVSYNQLGYRFGEIKKNVPDAIDAVSSPNMDLLVVLTPFSLIVYMGNDFANPTKFQLKKDESLIMAEWALGKYVDKWTLELSKYLQ